MEGLQTDHDYQIALSCNVVESAKRSRQDGTYDIIHKAKLLTATVVKDDGQIIYSKDQKTNSQKLRSMIYAMGEDYDEIMGIIMSNLEEIIQDYKYQR